MSVITGIRSDTVCPKTSNYAGGLGEEGVVRGSTVHKRFVVVVVVVVIIFIFIIVVKRMV